MRNRYLEQKELFLLERACGRVSEAHNLMADIMTACCEQAKAQARLCDDIGGALLDDCCEPVAMSRDGLSFLERLDDAMTEMEERQIRCIEKFSRRTGPLPEPLTIHIQSLPRSPKWRAAPGVKYCTIPTSCNTRIAIMDIKPGRKTPAHRHAGTEYTLILRGTLHDHGEVYRAGDFYVTEANTVHQPAAGPDEGCICIVMMEAPIRFTGPLGAMLNQFLR